MVGTSYLSGQFYCNEGIMINRLHSGHLAAKNVWFPFSVEIPTFLCLPTDPTVCMIWFPAIWSHSPLSLFIPSYPPAVTITTQHESLWSTVLVLVISSAENTFQITFMHVTSLYSNIYSDVTSPENHFQIICLKHYTVLHPLYTLFSFTA